LPLSFSFSIKLNKILPKYIEISYTLAMR